MWVEWREDAVVKEAVVVVVVVDVRSSAAEQLGAGHEAPDPHGPVISHQRYFNTSSIASYLSLRSWVGSKPVNTTGGRHYPQIRRERDDEQKFRIRDQTARSIQHRLDRKSVV